MNEQYARQMIREIDEARTILTIIDSMEIASRKINVNQVKIGYDRYSQGYNSFIGVNIPNDLVSKFLDQIKERATDTFKKYGATL